MTSVRKAGDCVSRSVLNETRPAVEQLPHLHFIGRTCSSLTWTPMREAQVWTSALNRSLGTTSSSGPIPAIQSGS